jgi:hypothetical protein
MLDDHATQPARPDFASVPTNLADQQAQDAQYLRAVLLELIEMGTDIARQVHRQSQAPQPPASQPPAYQTTGCDQGPEQNISPSQAERTIIAFDRITRTIRRTEPRRVCRRL